MIEERLKALEKLMESFEYKKVWLGQELINQFNKLVHKHHRIYKVNELSMSINPYIMFKYLDHNNVRYYIIVKREELKSCMLGLYK